MEFFHKLDFWKKKVAFQFTKHHETLPKCQKNCYEIIMKFEKIILQIIVENN